MKPGPGAKEGPVATALSLGAEALSHLGPSRGLLFPRFSLSGPKCLSVLGSRSLYRCKEEGIQGAGPGIPLAQDIHQQLAQDLLGLNWLLGCSVSVSVCCEGRSVQRSLSELVWRILPEGRGLFFFSCPSHFSSNLLSPKRKDDYAHSIDRVTDAQKI